MQLGRVVRAIALTLSTLACAAGCSGSSTDEGTGGGVGDPPEPGATIPEAQYVDQFVDALCSGLATCCETQGLAAAAAGCRAQFETAFAATPYPFGGGEGYAYDGQAAAACVAAARSSIAACHEVDAGDSCRDTYVGARAAGEPCASDEECASPPGGHARCGIQGVCEIDIAGQVGDPCAGTCTDAGDSGSCSGTVGLDPLDVTCWTNDGLYCAPDQTCHALVPLGSPCPYPERCVDEAYCSDSGSCEPRGATGALCTDQGMCLGLCNEITMLCEDLDRTPQPLTFTPAECAGETLPDFD